MFRVFRASFSSFFCSKKLLKRTPTPETPMFWKPGREGARVFHCGLPFVPFFAQEEIRDRNDVTCIQN